MLHSIMTTFRMSYLILIVLFVILISVQYFFFNPLSKISAISPMQSKPDHPVASLFFFKTTAKAKHLESKSLNYSSAEPESELESVSDSFNSSHSKFKRKLNVSSSSVRSHLTITNGTTVRSLQLTKSNSTSSNTSSESSLSFCPMPPPNLLGFLKLNLNAVPSLRIISRTHQDLDLGGHYKPPKCQPKDKVAIIVPFRDREEHLRIFLYNIHPVLKRQLIEYNIFVIEQSDGEPFNRAMLFNVGFVEGLKRSKFDCFIFHDVDLIPENDHNFYNCPITPRHMSVAVDKMKYQLPYKTIFGGISALRTEHFKLLNGFSNAFWGWGAEDDDMANRIAFRGMFISRPSPDVARYKMLKHKPQKLNNSRYKMLLKGKKRFNVDGLSNLNYTVEQIILEKLYTLIRVQLVRSGDG